MGGTRDARGGRKGKKDGKRDGVQHIALPHVVLKSRAWRALNFAARALLIDVAMQYHGKNNGRLTACRKVLAPLGWNSADTIDRALKELIANGLVVETRAGRFPATPRWLALTWYAIDWTEAMDVGRTFNPRGAYLTGGASNGAAVVPMVGATASGIAPTIGQRPGDIAPMVGAIAPKTARP